MMSIEVRIASRGFRAGFPAVRWAGIGVYPTAPQTPIWHAASPLHLMPPPRRYTASVRWPSNPKPNPTPWQWRRTPSWWSGQSPFLHQAPRVAMAGLASVPLGAVPRGGGFALGEVDDTTAVTPTLSPEQKESLPTATSDFRKVREQELLFVDKTPFISEVVRDKTEAFLITRHRRSGKSLNMTMLRCFLDRRYREQSAEWFRHLKVMDDPEAVKHRGKYPVYFWI